MMMTLMEARKKRKKANTMKRQSKTVRFLSLRLV